jgi:murein DD-endopeptidase MepM/ murein hydrolase activator NlpD
MQLKQNSKDSLGQSVSNGGQMMNISLFFKPSIMKVCSLIILVSLTVGIPAQAHAGLFDFITGSSTETADASSTEEFGTDTSGNGYNSQTYPFTETPINPDVKNMDQDAGAPIMGEDTLSSSTGLIGSGLESVSDGGITEYIVKEGDTLSQIAEDFDISQNTIRWANGFTGGNIKIGQKLEILPVTGVKHIVKKGDTLAGIANKYDADADDIRIFNDILSGDTLKAGDILIVPNGTITVQVSTPSKTSSTTPSSTTVSSKTISSGYYMWPTSGRVTSSYGSRKGGFHYGIDIGAPRGTNVVAAASGTVVEVVGYCVEGRISCGGRYGNYIVIEHANGQFTRYAHLSKVSVSIGQSVKKGKTIGSVGNTGHSTGPHLHFQIENSSGRTFRPVF